MTRAERRRAARDVAQQASRQAVQHAVQDAGANQIATNRTNASHSTGPRTGAGTLRGGSTAANQAIPRGGSTAANQRTDRSGSTAANQRYERSRWNALTHGLYARTLIHASKMLEADLAQFQSLRTALLEEYAP
jgi:hypothetical protein